MQKIYLFLTFFCDRTTEPCQSKNVLRDYSDKFPKFSFFGPFLSLFSEKTVFLPLLYGKKAKTGEKPISLSSANCQILSCAKLNPREKSKNRQCAKLNPREISNIVLREIKSARNLIRAKFNPLKVYAKHFPLTVVRFYSFYNNIY